MLRIKRFVDGEFAVFELSGRIEGENLEQLESLLSEEARRIVLDLKEVSLAGHESIQLLDHYEENGAKLRNCPAYIREWISKERGN